MSEWLEWLRSSCSVHIQLNQSFLSIQILPPLPCIQATDVSLDVSFKWAMQAVGTSGSGDGNLVLSQGDITIIFDVASRGSYSSTCGYTYTSGYPFIVPKYCTRIVITAYQVTSSFAVINLNIKANSVDWLYKVERLPCITIIGPL